jgi:hypothetical protein
MDPQTTKPENKKAASKCSGPFLNVLCPETEEGMEKRNKADEV